MWLYSVSFSSFQHQNVKTNTKLECYCDVALIDAAILFIEMLRKTVRSANNKTMADFLADKTTSLTRIKTAHLASPLLTWLLCSPHLT